MDSATRRSTRSAKSQRYRDRKLAAESVPFASPPTSTALMATLPGQEYPRLERRSTSHAWRYVPQIGWSRVATREQCRRFRVEPGTLEDDPGYGDPDYPRHALGHVPDDLKLVRVVMPPNERGIEVTRPVPARELEAALAAGARLAD